jgi:hypothetical protein
MSEELWIDESYSDLKDKIKILRETNWKLKNEFAEFRVQYSAMRRLIDKAVIFEIGYDKDGYHVTVEKRSDGRWAVVQLGFVLNDVEEWEYECLPSNRSDEFLERTRYPFDVAMEKAKKVIVSESLRAKLGDRVLEKEKQEEQDTRKPDQEPTQPILTPGQAPQDEKDD